MEKENVNIRVIRQISDEERVVCIKPPVAGDSDLFTARVHQYRNELGTWSPCSCHIAAIEIENCPYMGRYENIMRSPQREETLSQMLQMSLEK